MVGVGNKNVQNYAGRSDLLHYKCATLVGITNQLSVVNIVCVCVCLAGLGIVKKAQNSILVVGFALLECTTCLAS